MTPFSYCGKGIDYVLFLFLFVICFISAVCSFQMLPLNFGASEDVVSRGSSFPSDSQQSTSPLSDDVTAERSSYHLTGPVSDSAAGQYVQFLASVRNYQPLLADLNASVASVANSFSTLTQTSQGASQENVAEVESSSAVAPSAAASHHVSFQRSPAMSPIQLLQQQHQQQQHPTADGHLSNRSQMPSNGSDVYLRSPVQLDEGATLGQRQMMASLQQQQQRMTSLDQKMKSKTVTPSSKQKDLSRKLDFIVACNLWCYCYQVLSFVTMKTKYFMTWQN